MHVMKVVDLVTMDSDQLSLHFYDFSMNFYVFSKFTDFFSKVHVLFAL